MVGLRRCVLLCLALAVPAVADAAPERLQIVWPTPNPAYATGRPPSEYVQPTVSGLVESAFFGCVRNSGARFHEGVDLKPVSRDAKGEATDPVYAVMKGIVRHVNQTPGNSGYGRYIVIEHVDLDPAVLTLYAHLGRADAQAGDRVRAGQRIGMMGRSAGGYTIPRQRAHLHFEIGVWLSEDFPDWYASKRYTTPNQHGVFNGMNIVGLDAIDFYDRYRSGEVADFREYIDQLPVAFTLRVKADTMPDFVRRYPSLMQGGMPARGIGGWEIDFTSFGMPKRWRALPAGHSALDQKGRVQVVRHNPEVLVRHACLKTVRMHHGRPTLGSHTTRTIELMFGTR